MERVEKGTRIRVLVNTNSSDATGDVLRILEKDPYTVFTTTHRGYRRNVVDVYVEGRPKYSEDTYLAVRVESMLEAGVKPLPTKLLKQLTELNGVHNVSDAL